MQDCEEVTASLPIRQGDVIKRVEPMTDPALAIVLSADCDIANNKLTPAGLACVELVPLRYYVLCEHAAVTATRQLNRRYEKLGEWINKRWRLLDPMHEAISLDRIRSWVSEAPFGELETTLGVPSENSNFLRNEVPALLSAQRSIMEGGQYAGLDALRALQTKPTSRSDQAKALFSTLAPNNLPLDVFFLSSIPGEPDVGYVAKLRALSFIPLGQVFTSPATAREQAIAFLRVGRLPATFRHGLAQQFGMLFARIGYPVSYELDRDAAFAVVAESAVSELEVQRD